MNIVCPLLVPFGAIWFLQGINVLPGSFMTGQIRWAAYGRFAVALGISVLMAANRRRDGSMDDAWRSRLALLQSLDML